MNALNMLLLHGYLYILISVLTVQLLLKTGHCECSFCELCSFSLFAITSEFCGLAFAPTPNADFDLIVLSV